MKKTAFFIVLIISLFNLCGCYNQAQSKSLTEEKIIDENLKLKNQIAEMEEEKILKEERENIENEIQRELISFFQEVLSGEIEKANNMVTEHIVVDPSILTLNDGRQIYFQNNVSYIISIPENPETEWDGKDSVCMTVGIINHESTTNMKVCLSNEDGVWKIENIFI